MPIGELPMRGYDVPRFKIRGVAPIVEPAGQGIVRQNKEKGDSMPDLQASTRFEIRLPVVEEELSSGDRYRSRNGWLSPVGQFHPIACAGDHCEWCVREKIHDCYRNAYQPCRCRLELLGWAKLSDGHWIIPEPSKTTQSQLDFIFDWYLRRGEQPETFCLLLQEMAGKADVI
jgi:hypothetical protein